MAVPCAVKLAVVNPVWYAWVLVLLALGLVVGAWVLEYGFGAQPCVMCWWQRYSHWGIGVCAVLGVIDRCGRGRVAGFSGVLVCSALGLGVALWQTAAQLGLLTLPEFCGAAGAALPLDVAAALAAPPPPRCDSWGWTLLGLSLAMWNSLVMCATSVLAALGLRAQLRAKFGQHWGMKP